MPHVCLVALSGVRVVHPRLRELGLTLPGLRKRAQALAALPALGLLTLAGATPAPWTCSYHEAPGDDEALAQEIAARRPVLVALSALTASVDGAYALSGRLRALGLPTVLGGLHASMCPDEALQHVDAVCIGDGEAAWPAILADARAGRLQPRYRAPADLARAPLPRFDLAADKPRPRFTLQTARGCPLACEFCGASRLLGAFREKPLELIERELDAICALTRRPVIELADDNTWAGSRDHGALLRALGRRGVRWFTEADWRIGRDPRLVRQLAEAGCVQVLMGVESPRMVPSGMGPKQANVNEVLDSIENLQDAGVAVNACFIAGMDGETPQTLEELADFILACPAADVQVTLQTPFPGTALRRRLLREGRLLPCAWSAYTLFDVTFVPERMTVAELERGFEALVRAVYSAQAQQARATIRREVSRETELQSWE
ncbi:radical SAM protein [bacterium]|nr:MAG: radical SAM protein [bacterium]RIK63025.1 MAG: B12-binding domain-containing radical SAM protein [Planctomycetota bacterium]